MWYRKRLRNKKLTSNQVGLVHGFRSGLEEQIATELRGLRVQYEFEETKLKYVKPTKTHTYTPDFYLPKQKIYIVFNKSSLFISWIGFFYDLF